MNVVERSLYFDRQGNPIDMWECNRLLMDDEYRVVERTEIPFKSGSDETLIVIVVSTVWMGINHAWRYDWPPQIFETQVFGGPDTGEIYRYSTEEEAHLGHSGVVEMQYLKIAQARRGN